jgi:uracil DNA glycosylase
MASRRIDSFFQRIPKKGAQVAGSVADSDETHDADSKQVSSRKRKKPESSTCSSIVNNDTKIVDDPSDPLQLSSMLNPHWRTCLESTLRSQANVERYIGVQRPFTIPTREHTFRALNGLPPDEWRVTIIGQDPYPRAESAVGVAFYDGKIKDWKNAMSPSFRNLVKNALYCKGHLQADSKVGEMRSQLRKLRVLQPPEWFEHTMAQGVLWLNTSLTFSSKDKTELDKHTKFWRPIMVQIFVYVTLYVVAVILICCGVTLYGLSVSHTVSPHTISLLNSLELSPPLRLSLLTIHLPSIYQFTDAGTKTQV